MKSLYKLVVKTNIKGPSIAFPIIMPFVFILLYSAVMVLKPDQTINQAVAAIYVTILSITTMQSGLMGFGINFITIKKSVLLRRIGATELSKMDVVLAMILFGLTLWVISFVWILLVTVIFTYAGIFYVTDFNGAVIATADIGWVKEIMWGRLMITTLLMLFLSYTLGMFFTTIAKDDQAYMGIAMMYFFFAGFFGGLMFAGDVPEWMNTIGYLVPHGYIDPLYDWANGISINNTQAMLGVLVPIVVGILSLIGAVKLLKFD